MSATSGVPGFPDLFFGPKDKAYIDRQNKAVTRIKGYNVLYYPLLDQTRRIDGPTPVSDAAGLGPFTPKRHSGDPLYGDPSILVETKINSVQVVKKDWFYGEPLALRGVPNNISTNESPDERGTIYDRTMTFDLARVICEEVGEASYLQAPLRPRQGDVIKFESLLDGFFEVNDVSRDDSRFGITGFFAVYRCELTQTSKHLAWRKELPGFKEPQPSEDE